MSLYSTISRLVALTMWLCAWTTPCSAFTSLRRLAVATRRRSLAPDKSSASAPSSGTRATFAVGYSAPGVHPSSIDKATLKLEAKLLKGLSKCALDYEMIEDGDHLMVRHFYKTSPSS
jgi:hypothetical protein